MSWHFLPLDLGNLCPGICDFYVIILNGINGPATFALSELLTSHPNITHQPGSAVDEILKKLMLYWQQKSEFRGVQLLIKAVAGFANGENESKEKAQDCRQVLSWEILPNSIKLIRRS